MCVLKYHTKTYYFVLIYTGCKRKKKRERETEGMAHSTGCSCTGLGFSSQHIHGSHYHLVSRNPMLSTGLKVTACMWCTNKYADKRPMHIKLKIQEEKI